MTSPLWTWNDLVAASGGTPDGEAAAGVSGASIDTRTLRSGDLFIALKDKRDGHDFVEAAFKSGAAVAIVSQSYARRSGDGALIRVPDPLPALESIGRAARERISTDARIIAVTGSAGKTGTKEMLRAALSAVGATHASEKSYNNHWGAPLTLARMPAATRYGAFELGMNHAGEIRPLAKLVRPHVAIITTVEAVHLEHFDSVEAIADAKAEIFEGLEPSGVAIIKHSSPYAGRLAAAAARVGGRPMTFGFDRSAAVWSDDLEIGEDAARMTVSVSGRRVPVTLAAAGRHIAENALAVVAALDAVGADLEPALAALAALGPPPGRGQRFRLNVGGGSALLIDESYNANPASMRAALDALAAAPRVKFSRRIAVLGDMLELGHEAAALHRDLKDAVVATGVDQVFACGPHMKGLYDALPQGMRGSYAAAAGDLAPDVAKALRAGDIVMIKGSNATGLGPIVEDLKSRFADDGGR